MRAKLVSESLNEHMDAQINEGLGDIIVKYSGKIKGLFSQAVSKLSPEKMNKLRQEVAPFKGMSFSQIKDQLKSKASETNESLAGKIFNFTGLTIFSSFVAEIAIMVTDEKYDWFTKLLRSFGVDTMDLGMNMLIATMATFAALVLWLFVKLDSQEESWADATRPSGTTSAERHSSGYIASQMKRRERASNEGYVGRISKGLKAGAGAVKQHYSDMSADKKRANEIKSELRAWSRRQAKGGDYDTPKHISDLQKEWETLSKRYKLGSWNKDND